MFWEAERAGNAFRARSGLTLDHHQHCVWPVQGNCQAQSFEVPFLMEQVRKLLLSGKQIRGKSETNLWVVEKTKTTQKAADLAITVKKSVVLVNKRLNSLTPILGSGGAGWLQVWTLSQHSLPFTALYGTKSTHFIICSSCLACASFSSISVTSYEKQDKTLLNPTLIQKDFDLVMK